MARKEFTPEQKRQYLTEAHAKWQAAKKLAETDPILAIFHQLQDMGLGEISLYNVSLVAMQAAAAGLDGLPYVHFKTFAGWQASGRQVRRGEHSQVSSITWVGPKSKEDGDEASDGCGGFRWPKATALFHESQTDPVVS